MDPGEVDRGEAMATCPECDAEIEVDEFEVDEGDRISCDECGSNLKVVSLSPLEFDLASDEDDDDEDDEDEVADGEDDVVEEEDDEDDEDEEEI
jgi:alpha-aminoadipate carrier protein LysW